MSRDAGAVVDGSDASGALSVWLVFALAAAAGYVDSVGYLSLANVFTSHMSGNMAALGAYAGANRLFEANNRLVAIPLFLLGVGIGVATNELWKRRTGRASYTPALAAEAAILVILGGFGGSLQISKTANGLVMPQFWWAVAGAAIAMGIQSATVRRAARNMVRTSFLTGDLVAFVEAIVNLILVKLRLSPEGADSEREQLDRARLYGGVSLCFLAGAVLGGAMQVRFQLRAELLGAAAVAVVAWFDWRANRVCALAPTI